MSPQADSEKENALDKLILHINCGRAVQRALMTDVEEGVS